MKKVKINPSAVSVNSKNRRFTKKTGVLTTPDAKQADEIELNSPSALHQAAEMEQNEAKEELKSPKDPTLKGVKRKKNIAEDFEL